MKSQEPRIKNQEPREKNKDFWIVGFLDRSIIRVQKYYLWISKAVAFLIGETHKYDILSTDKFTKSERLSNKRLIKELFSKGSSFYLYPFKVFYFPLIGKHGAHQVLVSIPKRIIKKATDRNRIRRKIKEAYRLRKKYLTKDDQSYRMIAYIYTAKEQCNYHLICKQLNETIVRMNNHNL